MAAPALSAPLAAWAAAHGKDFEAVAQTRDADAPAADRALEIVRAFIVERGLILYGGQAIDCALRLRGARIYPDHQTPDYDFYSPRSVDDAYDLAERLHSAGFGGVGAIPAIHVQTMRVKTDFIFVADISYAPPAVFDSFPTVDFAGMRVLHPDYQRADMHLAFCFPFSNPPREDVFHRFRKDLKRFNIFEELYPLTTGAALAAGGAPPAAAEAPLAAAVEVDLARVAVHGFAAYGLLRAAFDLLAAGAEEAGVGAPALAAARALAAATPAVAVSFEAAGGSRCRVRLAAPAADARLCLATPWPGAVAAALAAARPGGGAVAWAAPYMDSRPLTARVSGGGAPAVDVFSTRGRLLAVAVVDGPPPPERDGPATEAAAAPPVRVTMVSPQYLLLGFLHEAHAAAGAARDLYVEFYRATLRLLEAAGGLIAALRVEGGGPAVSGDVFRALVESSPFGLPVRPLGADNSGGAYLIRLAGSARAVGDVPPGVAAADLPAPEDTPPKFFPGGAKTRPAFDCEAHAAFQRYGQPIPPPAFLAETEPPPPPETSGG